MIEIVRGSVNKPVCADSLIRLMSATAELSGKMYVGYPIFSTTDGKLPIDALIVHPKKGVVVINFIEGVNVPSGYRDEMDDTFSKVQSKLQGCRQLVERRSLALDVNVVTYAPAILHVEEYADAEYRICNDTNLILFINSIPDDDRNSLHYDQAQSVLQSITTLRSGVKRRNVMQAASRGAILQSLENSIATLDHSQGRAVIESVDGVQRIRGLAGSGKTVVLALKAAYLHVQHPEWKIVVTFHTRSLKEQFKRLITGFVIEQAAEEPNWENIKIIHAWGSGSGDREGVYYDFCVAHNVPPMDYSLAKSRYGLYDAFTGACRLAVEGAKDDMEEGSTFDAILVDEAQDLPVEFLRICYKMLKAPKRLVYAYDELQSLTKKSLPSPEEIFGMDRDGRPIVNLKSPAQDITLGVCYRNSRPVLSTAHALGFGIYREPDSKTGTGLVQMFDDKALWKSVGYSVDDGVLEEGRDVTLYRDRRNSPEFLESPINIDDMMVFKAFENTDEQTNWLVSQIVKNVTEEELRPDDIIVINPDPLTTRRNTGPIRAKLLDANIMSHLVGVDTAPDVFFQPEIASVTFSGVFRAKGNEAGMVYIINAQDCYNNPAMLSTVRNRLFTAITRSKAWVRVLGVGDRMRCLVDEFQTIKRNDFKLRFTYPTEDLRKKIRVVNRDKSNESCKIINDASLQIASLVDAFQSGGLHIEDLDKSQLDLLRQHIESGS